MSTMKALVSHPSGELKLEEVPVPALGANRYAPHDVLCEVVYCGICGSDIHKWNADKTGVKTTSRSVVAGHEIVSVVKAVGPAVTRVKPGDRVVHEIVTMYCGRCPACLEGRFNICNTLPPMEGRAHFVTGGGFAKLTVWPEWQLHVLPASISDKAAVLMEPVAGLGAHDRQPHGGQGRRVGRRAGPRGARHPADPGVQGDRGRAGHHLRTWSATWPSA